MCIQTASPRRNRIHPEHLSLLSVRNSWTRSRIIVSASTGTKIILNSILVQWIPFVLIITIYPAYIVEDQSGEDQISTRNACNLLG